MSNLFRLYAIEELGADGYPAEWHATLKHEVREAAGHRCVRCGHPYRRGENPLVAETDEEGRTVWASWSPCDERCTHGGPVRVWFQTPGIGWQHFDDPRGLEGMPTEARWRILTVHHLDMNKANCRWWNLVSLCQRCHLEIQLKVRIQRRWLHEHSAWFRPYVAGYYAFFFLGEDLAREEVDARLDELLELEHRQIALFFSNDQAGEPAAAVGGEVTSPIKETA